MAVLPFTFRAARIGLGLILGAAWLPAGAGAEPAVPSKAGLPFIQSFGVHDYNEFAQNWVATQDADGVLYVGNTDGLVLTYDGQEWGSIKAGGFAVRGLAFDASGRLWYGSIGDLGYLERNGRGGFTCVSLRDRLPAAVRDNLIMYHLISRPDGVFFFTRDYVLRWHDGKFDVEKIRYAWPLTVGNRLLRHGAGRPLEEWRDGAWHTLADLPELRRHRVRFATTLPGGALLLATAHDGFFRLAHGVLTPWHTEIDAMAKTVGIDRGLQLRDGCMAISHRPQGFSIIDQQGHLRYYFSDRDSPLLSPIVWAFFQDRRGDLWVMLDVGMARIEQPSGNETYFGQTGGVRRFDANTFCPFHGGFYLGMADGLWRYSPADAGAVPPKPARFERVPGIDRNVCALYDTPDELLIGCDNGLLIWRDDGTPPQSLLKGTYVWQLWVSRLDPTRALVGTPEGVLQLQRGPDGWHLAGRLPSINTEVRAFRTAADGSLWMATLNRGYIRMLGVPGTASADGQPIRIEDYPGGHGFPSARLPTHTTLAETDGRIRFFDDGRMFHFDAASRRFVEDFDIAKRFGEPGAEVVRSMDDVDGNLWVYLRPKDAAGWPAQGMRAFRLSESGKVQALPYRMMDFIGSNPMFQEMAPPSGSKTLWIAGSDGMVRIGMPEGLNPPPRFKIFLRGITDATQHALPLVAGVRLPYADRSLHLRVATDRLGDSNLRYQSRLDADGWSAWGASPWRSFERLPVGRHELLIRARDSNGAMTTPLRFAVVVLPPWWLTGWALAGFALVAAAGLYGFVRWRMAAVYQRTVKLESVVAQRTAALRAREQQLLEARDAAESSNRAKSVFLASMSHELRTPLNAILGYAQLLRHAPGLTPESRRQVETVRASGDHLLQMINDVLDLAKVEAGKVELLVRPLSLSRLLAHLTEVFEPRAAQKAIAFALHGETPLPDQVMGDEARLRQVLYNLLANAIKFTERGRVELRVAAEGERVRFAVTDTGVGIAPAEQTAIFGLFHQAAGSAQSGQGAGLGLAISQRLIRLMGGEIKVESVPGEGSRFWFELELPPAAPVSPASNAERLPRGYCGSRQRVLIVDDEAVNRDVLRALLAPLGFDLEEAEDEEAAVAAVKAWRPALVLLDLRLKHGDGLSAARRMRALPEGNALRIMAISASVFPIDRTQADEAGCDEFEPKPIRTDQLLAKIGRLLGLEWEWPQASAGTRNPILPEALPDAWPLPPSAVLEELDEHADLGDLTAFRACVASARMAHPVSAAFLDALDTLAAEARLASLRAWLAAAHHRSTNPAP